MEGLGGRLEVGGAMFVTPRRTWASLGLPAQGMLWIPCQVLRAARALAVVDPALRPAKDAAYDDRVGLSVGKQQLSGTRFLLQ